MRNARHELYRDANRWREIAEGVADWCVDKSLRFLGAGNVTQLTTISDSLEDNGSEPVEHLSDQLLDTTVAMGVQAREMDYPTLISTTIPVTNE